MKVNICKDLDSKIYYSAFDTSTINRWLSFILVYNSKISYFKNTFTDFNFNIYSEIKNLINKIAKMASQYIQFNNVWLA